MAGFSFKIIAFAACFFLAMAIPQAHAVTQGEICDQNQMMPALDDSIQGSYAKKNEMLKTSFAPPASVEQIANTPCMSKELQKISRMVSYAPTMYSSQVMGNFTAMAGPLSGLMNKVFKSSFQSISQAAGIHPRMLNFQSQASSILGDLLGSLGLGDLFSSEVCGLMVDMVLKYIQCENPIKLPNLSKLTGSLNNLLPNGCAGAALRSTLYQAGNMKALRTYNQPFSTNSSGRIVAGSATEYNKSRGIE